MIIQTYRIIVFDFEQHMFDLKNLTHTVTYMLMGIFTDFSDYYYKLIYVIVD
jgi:hypothetical protein